MEIKFVGFIVQPGAATQTLNGHFLQFPINEFLRLMIVISAGKTTWAKRGGLGNGQDTKLDLRKIGHAFDFEVGAVRRGNGPKGAAEPGILARPGIVQDAVNRSATTCHSF